LYWHQRTIRNMGCETPDHDTLDHFRNIRQDGDRTIFILFS